MPQIIIGLCLLLLVSLGISYNRFVSQRNFVRDSWSNIQTELQRRYDLIPNLVETVKGYAAHEEKIFTAVTEARVRAVSNHGPADIQAKDENALVGQLKTLFAVSENYPDLKASSQFLALQRQLIETEDRIQASRRLYNGNVRDLNRRVESIPSSMVASIFGFERAEYFEVGPAVGQAPPPTSF